MYNPMMTNLTASRLMPAITQVKGIMNAGNPRAMLAQMPQYRNVMDYVNSNGGDPREAFYKKAQEMGIDPSAILSQLR